MAQEGEVARVPLLHADVGRPVGIVPPRVRGRMRSPRDVGIARFFVGARAPRHAQVHQLVLAENDDFRRAAFVPANFEAAHDTVEDRARRFRRADRDGHFFAEIEHGPIEIEQLFVGSARAGAFREQTYSERFESCGRLIDLEPQEIPREFAVDLAFEPENRRGRIEHRFSHRTPPRRHASGRGVARHQLARVIHFVPFGHRSSLGRPRRFRFRHDFRSHFIDVDGHGAG